jgi:hypothetical protein
MMNPATYFRNRPLQVHRTVLDWLRAGCDGAVIVAPRSAARLLLNAPGRIAGQDVAHARAILDTLYLAIDPGRVVVPVQETA